MLLLNLRVFLLTFFRFAISLHRQKLKFFRLLWRLSSHSRFPNNQVSDFLLLRFFKPLNKRRILLFNGSQPFHPRQQEPRVKILLSFPSISIELTFHILLIDRLINSKPTALNFILRWLKLGHLTDTFLREPGLEVISSAVVWHIALREGNKRCRRCFWRVLIFL